MTLVKTTYTPDHLRAAPPVHTSNAALTSTRCIDFTSPKFVAAVTIAFVKSCSDIGCSKSRQSRRNRTTISSGLGCSALSDVTVLRSTIGPARDTPRNVAMRVSWRQGGQGQKTRAKRARRHFGSFCGILAARLHAASRGG